MAAKFSVHVTPNAGRNEIRGWRAGEVKIKVAAPAVDGKANEELVRFLAETLKIHRREVSIERGETSRSKVIRVDGLTMEQILERLGIAAEGS